MTIEREIASDLLEPYADGQSGLLLIMVGASALFWGIVFLLLV